MRVIPCMFYIMIQVSGTAAVGISEGKEFLISTPSMKYSYNPQIGYPRLVLTLMSGVRGPIKVTTEGLIGTSDFVETKFTINPLKPLKIYNDKLFFGPDHNSGPRWAYHLTADSSFVVLVSMETDMHIVETFTAVPVSGWGSHYAIVTLDQQFSVVVVANEYGNTITFTLKFHDRSFRLTVNGVVHKHGSELKVELAKYQAYSIGNCFGNDDSGSMTGSILDGIRPFGVVTGNCNGTTKIQRCNSVYGTSLLNATSGSAVAEMLLPIETAGKLFLLFAMTGRYSPGYFLILALHDMTGVGLGIKEPGETQEKRLNFDSRGTWATEKGEFTTAWATNPIQIMYIQNSSCYFSSEGDPSMLIVTPLELFYFIYYCMTPNTKMRHFITVVINDNFKDSLKTIISEGDETILGLASQSPKVVFFLEHIGTFTILEYEVKGDVSLTVYSLRTRFACYVHGVSYYATYMHTAGFISSNINQVYCLRSETNMMKGDLMDNDCDGWVDEEIANGINHRYDYYPDEYDDIVKVFDNNAIDEDLGFYFKEEDTIYSILTSFPAEMRERELSTFTSDYVTPGLVYTTPGKRETTRESDVDNIPFESQADFGDWSEWQCSNNCNDTNVKRTRTCLRMSTTEKCQGSSRQEKRAYCYAKTCPLDCPEKTFGDTCKFKCPNCDGDCDKFNGSCTLCLPGLEYPETGCLIDIHLYESWSDWKCSEECGKPYMLRERKGNALLCKEDKSNCVKTLKELAPGDCNNEKKCQKDCREYTWGPNCNNTCENCEKPCNKFTGECLYCRGGFQDEKNACSKPCEVNQYGPGCTYNCHELCGEGFDCIERVHGACPTIPRSSSSNYVFTAVVVIVLVAAASSIYFVFKFKKIEELEVAKSMMSLKYSKSKSKQSLASRSKQSLLSKSVSQRSVARIKDEGSDADSLIFPTEIIIDTDKSQEI